jgi:hypothetical protein
VRNFLFQISTFQKRQTKHDLEHPSKKAPAKVRTPDLKNQAGFKIFGKKFGREEKQMRRNQG